MFPTPASGGGRPDPNRDHRFDPHSGRPRSLDVAYWILVAGAVASLVAGLMLVTARVPLEIIEWSAEHAANVRRNLVFVGVANLLAGLAVAATAPQVRRGSVWGRRACTAVIAVICLINLLALATRVAGLAVVVGVVVFAAAAVAMFRPDANGYVRRRSWNAD